MWRMKSFTSNLNAISAFLSTYSQAQMNVLPETSRGGTLHKDPLSNTVTLSCEEGYKLPDITISTFTNGKWNPSQLECLPLSDVAELPTVNGKGTVTSTSEPPYHFNDRAILKCDPGYTVSSTHIAKVVVENGSLKWNPSEFRCNPKMCLHPPNIPDGEFIPLKNTYHFTDFIEYKCNPGFTLETTNNIISRPQKYFCSAAGNWEPPIYLENIKCIQDFKWCPELKAPEHGSVKLTDGQAYGSIASFVCDKGFFLTGTPERVCQENKIWDGKEVTCKPQLACPEKMTENFYTIDKGTHYMVFCSEPSLQWIKVACINGRWEYKNEYCSGKRMDILFPLTVDNNPSNINTGISNKIIPNNDPSSININRKPSSININSDPSSNNINRKPSSIINNNPSSININSKPSSINIISYILWGFCFILFILFLSTFK